MIDDKNAEKFFRILFTPLLIIHVIEGVLIGLGALCLISTIAYGVILRYRMNKEVGDALCSIYFTPSLPVNPIPDNKILDRCKLKQIADDILKCI